MIIVESYYPARTSGLHGSVHIRPIGGQGFSTSLYVECSKSLTRNFPVGTRFRIKVKLTDREGGRQFLYIYFGWKYDVIGKPYSTPANAERVQRLFGPNWRALDELSAGIKTNIARR